MKISVHKSLTEVQADLCARFRQLHKAEQNGTAKCMHCEEVFSRHTPDGRCSVYSHSPTYVSAGIEELAQVSRMLELVEELITHGG